MRIPKWSVMNNRVTAFFTKWLVLQNSAETVTPDHATPTTWSGQVLWSAIQHALLFIIFSQTRPSTDARVVNTRRYSTSCCSDRVLASAHLDHLFVVKCQSQLQTQRGPMLRTTIRVALSDALHPSIPASFYAHLQSAPVEWGCKSGSKQPPRVPASSDETPPTTRPHKPKSEHLADSGSHYCKEPPLQ